MQIRLPLAALLLTASAAAQPRPIFDPDDFVDPRQREGPVFVSRLAIGVAWNLIDDYRPVDQNAGFVHVANSFYWSQFEIAYKRTEVRGQDMSAPARAQRCPERINVSPVGGCNPNVPPILFPARSAPDATPAAPPPGSKDALQFGWYRRAGE